MCDGIERFRERLQEQGWTHVDGFTSVRFTRATGRPMQVRSLRRNLDAAFDDAQQHWGEPLDHGTWTPSCDPDDAWTCDCSPAKERV